MDRMVEQNSHQVRSLINFCNSRNLALNCYKKTAINFCKLLLRFQFLKTCFSYLANMTNILSTPLACDTNLTLVNKIISSSEAQITIVYKCIVALYSSLNGCPSQAKFEWYMLNNCWVRHRSCFSMEKNLLIFLI